jgi:NADH-quinone oxidoreductase subunit L
LIAVVITLLGVYTGYELYYRSKSVIEQWKQSPLMTGLREFFYEGWAFDRIYDFIFVRPFVFITELNKADVFDWISKGFAGGAGRLNRWFSFSQNGSLRWYVAGILFGIIFIVTLEFIL